ncbi:hypothetical protein [Pedobacter puniceum]|uniref:Uncharacterized protein n=1 Tax=Pedobacter puniceum TaxID=2666136 RepID=A0A7K0FKN9_9SPHI|nr:hypothetical protein [Pedobacter puniceum]MRX45830.1 hypothetical protein [Pedobacter puniceum]
MQFKYYKDQIIEVASLLEYFNEELIEKLINIALEGEMKELDDVYKSGKFNFQVEEFYQFDNPVLNQLCELSEHIEKVKTFLEDTYPNQENFYDIPDDV